MVHGRGAWRGSSPERPFKEEEGLGYLLLVLPVGGAIGGAALGVHPYSRASLGHELLGATAGIVISTPLVAIGVGSLFWGWGAGGLAFAALGITGGAAAGALVAASMDRDQGRVASLSPA